MLDNTSEAALSSTKQPALSTVDPSLLPHQLNLLWAEFLKIRFYEWSRYMLRYLSSGAPVVVLSVKSEILKATLSISAKLVIKKSWHYQHIWVLIMATKLTSNQEPSRPEGGELLHPQKMNLKQWLLHHLLCFCRCYYCHCINLTSCPASTPVNS